MADKRIPIVAPPSATYDTVKANIPATAHPRFTGEMLPHLWREAPRGGIDPVVMVAQCAWETGWGHYGGTLPPESSNVCGLKTRSGGDNKDPRAHEFFYSFREGAIAQRQHLRSYVGLPITGPRFTARAQYVEARNQPVTYVEELGGRWAPNPDYGRNVAKTVRLLRGEG